MAEKILHVKETRAFNRQMETLTAYNSNGWFITPDLGLSARNVKITGILAFIQVTDTTTGTGIDEYLFKQYLRINNADLRKFDLSVTPAYADISLRSGIPINIDLPISRDDIALYAFNKSAASQNHLMELIFQIEYDVLIK